LVAAAAAVPAAAAAAVPAAVAASCTSGFCKLGAQALHPGIL
jgi:hypothetical protein